jgi:hypothetical protein
MLDGGGGGGAVTETVAESWLVAPSSSVTVSFTVYRFALVARNLLPQT